ncbi:MAG: hypothetical protein ACRCZ9_08590 [Fusobacteriaceae bacterium]
MFVRNLEKELIRKQQWIVFLLSQKDLLNKIKEIDDEDFFFDNEDKRCYAINIRYKKKILIKINVMPYLIKDDRAVRVEYKPGFEDLRKECKLIHKTSRGLYHICHTARLLEGLDSVFVFITNSLSVSEMDFEDLDFELKESRK